MNYLQLVKILLPYLIGGAIAGGAAWMIQGARVDTAKADLKQSRTDLTSCQDANASDQATIGLLKAEIGKLETTCTERVAAKETVITRIREIDALRPAQTKTTEVTGDNKEHAPASGTVDNPVLDMLGRMFDGTDPGNQN